VKQNYEAADWEEQYAKLRVVTPVDPNDRLTPRTLIAGLAINGKAMAYPLPALEKQRLILDNIVGESGATPLFIVLGDDNKSVRAFERTVDGRTLEFFVKADKAPIQLIDAETATTSLVRPNDRDSILCPKIGRNSPQIITDVTDQTRIVNIRRIRNASTAWMIYWLRDHKWPCRWPFISFSLLRESRCRS
jgi:hypothetical protein